MNYAIALKKARGFAGINQQQLADLCQLDQSYISKIESGQRRPNTELLESISNALGMPSYCILFLAMEESDLKTNRKREVFELIKPSVENLLALIINEEKVAEYFEMDEQPAKGYDSQEIRLLNEAKGGNSNKKIPKSLVR